MHDKSHPPRLHDYGAMLDGSGDLDTSWKLSAACRGIDPNAFHPGRGEYRSVGAAALAICAGCEVDAACLEWRLATVTDLNDSGIWGGTTARERRVMRGVERATAS